MNADSGQAYAISFDALLDRLAIEPGGVYFVHSNWDRLQRFGAPATEIIRALQARITPDGLLCFPTYPWIYKSYPRTIELKFRAENTFVPAKTPSRSGLLSEIFRRSPDVHRSAHPWVPVAAWGNRGQSVVAGAESVQDLYDPESAFGRLLAADVAVVGLGVSVGTSSFGHYPDWLFRHRVGYRIFEVVTVAGRPFEIIPEAIQRITFPAPMFENDPELKAALRFVNLYENYFFSHKARAFTEAACKELELALARDGFPCWFSSDPHNAS